MPLTISVIIPVLNGESHLRKCLQALATGRASVLETIVVDDGSSDGSVAVAREFGATVLQTSARTGPARARNLGAAAASGDLLLFIDADVYVHPDTVHRVRWWFETNPSLDALIGSYDDAPSETNYLSQYKNLTHSFVHRHSCTDASTFWTGCGAIRKELYLAHHGLSETYRRPSIEDIELGYRLRRAGATIMLDPELQVTHGKRWTLTKLLASDILDRAIPWTELILRSHRMPNDLNLRTTQRICVTVAYLLVLGVALILAPVSHGLRLLAGTLAVSSGLLLVALNAEYYRFLSARRGILFAIRAFPLQALYYVYGGAAFAAGLVRHIFRTRVNRGA